MENLEIIEKDHKILDNEIKNYQKYNNIEKEKIKNSYKKVDRNSYHNLKSNYDNKLIKFWEYYNTIYCDENFFKKEISIEMLETLINGVENEIIESIQKEESDFLTLTTSVNESYFSDNSLSIV